MVQTGTFGSRTAPAMQGLPSTAGKVRVKSANCLLENRPLFLELREPDRLGQLVYSVGHPLEKERFQLDFRHGAGSRPRRPRTPKNIAHDVAYGGNEHTILPCRECRAFRSEVCLERFQLDNF